MLPHASHRIVSIAVVALTIASGAATADTVATVSSRGQAIRVLVNQPAATPAGSVVLLAGGHGRLDIAADGKLGWGGGNQLVRTRVDYTRAGFVSIVPDIAPDMKTADGVKNGYRWSAEHAQDIGAIIKFARGLGGPVHLVGTSRAALTVAKAGASITSGDGRPDSIVITAGMLMAVNAKQPSAQKNVSGLGNIKQPVLLIHHNKDACGNTPASSPAQFKPLLAGAKRVDIRMLDGGDVGSGDPCQAQSHHGFLGQDGEVVKLITDWARASK